MIQIIERSKLVHIVEYRLFFESRQEPGRGFTFPCDVEGNVYMDELADIAKESLAMCRMSDDYTDGTVQRYDNSYRTAKVGRCYCGRRVYLGNFTNECECGRFFNMSGQQLTPPAQWGEETGEQFDSRGNLILG